jgi:hypothetical protein
LKQKPYRNVPVAVPVESAYLANMSVPLSRVLFFACAVLVLGADATASARPKRQPSAERTSTQVTACDGTPIIMQGMECRQRAAPAGEQETKGAPRPRVTARGSGGPYIAPVQRTPSLSLPQPSASPYIPPPINNPSERIKQLNESFPLNGGLGNNPTNRDEYIRYNLTR